MLTKIGVKITKKVTKIKIINYIIKIICYIKYKTNKQKIETKNKTAN